MNGIVDQSLRALLDISVSPTKETAPTPLRVWIDTAFNGGLVIPRPQIERLGLTQASTTQAVLADGSLVDLETYTCYLQWFDGVYRTQVVANDGDFPLLGTLLLAGRRLTVDYQTRQVVLA